MSDKYHDICGRRYTAKAAYISWAVATVVVPVALAWISGGMASAGYSDSALWVLGAAVAALVFCGSFLLFHRARYRLLSEMRDIQAGCDTLADDHSRFVANLPGRTARAERALHMLCEAYGQPQDVTEIWGGNTKLVKYNVIQIGLAAPRSDDAHGSLVIHFPQHNILRVSSNLKAERHPVSIDSVPGHVVETPPEDTEPGTFVPPDEPQQPLPL